MSAITKITKATPFKRLYERLGSINETHLRNGSIPRNGSSLNIELRSGAIAPIAPIYFLPNLDTSTLKCKSIDRSTYRFETDEENEARRIKVAIAKRLATSIEESVQESLKLYEERKREQSRKLRKDSETLKANFGRLRSDKSREERRKTISIIEKVIYFKTSAQRRSLNIGNSILDRATMIDFIDHAIYDLELPEELSSDSQLVALTSYYCTATKIDGKRKHKGFLESLPNEVIDNGSLNTTECRVLSKHFLVDIEGIQTAKELESYRGWRTKFERAGLSRIPYLIPAEQVAQLVAPSPQDQMNDPVIRSWSVYVPNKWSSLTSNEEARKGAAWTLEYGAGVYDRETNTFDISAMKRNWYSEFKEAGLSHMLAKCPHTPTPLEAVKLGARELGNDNLIGTNDEQVPPWWVSYPGMWQEVSTSGEMLIDDVTDYVIEKYIPSNEPQLLKDGALDPNKVKSFGGWSKLYDSVATDCLKLSGLSPQAALRRRAPTLFGYKENQIKPWEMKYKNMWQVENGGEELFRQAFAYALAKDGVGTFDPPFYHFSLGAYEDYVQREFKSQSKRFRDYFNGERSLSGGFKYVTGSNETRALRVLLNLKPEEEIPQTCKIRFKAIDDLHTKTLIKFLNSKCDKPFNGYAMFTKEDEAAGKVLRTDSLTLDGTSLEGIVDKSKNHPATNALYKITEIATDLNSDSLKDESRTHILEKMLNAKTPIGSGGRRHVHSLSNHDLRELLFALKNEIVDDINLIDRSKKEIRYLLREILKHKSPRNVLLASIEASKEECHAPTPLTNLNDTLEFITSAIYRHGILDGKIERDTSRKGPSTANLGYGVNF